MNSVAGCSAAEMTRWLEPFYPSPPLELVARLESYLALLLRWNERTNLTAVRDAKGVVERHFGESLFAATHVPDSCRTLLDLGSGAGFPGIPIALCRPDLRVTLAESQGKKAAFLRECCRTLQLDAEVWAKRVEEMPTARHFDAVTLRAVDNSGLARTLAQARVARGGLLMELRSCETESPAQVPIPHSHRRCLVLTPMTTVPRGTE